MQTSKLMIIASAVLALASATPASATCLKRPPVPLPNAQIELMQVGGKTLKRQTDAAGVLTLKGLRSGSWMAKIIGEIKGATMQVGPNGLLIIQSMSHPYSCSAPGGPVSHGATKSLVKINK